MLFWGNISLDSVMKAPQFHYKMNDFRFAYAAPYYEHLKHIFYRYMLEGFDDNWSEWTTKTEKEYTNLAKGTYTFRVQARNAYSQESAVASFAFSILPAWYFSWYAKTAYFIIGLLSIMALAQFFRKREKRKTHVLKIQQAKTLQQQEQAHQRKVAETENEVIRLKNEKLQNDINYKNSQLASVTMHLVQKNEILNQIQEDLEILHKTSGENKGKIKKILKIIESDSRLDDDWEQFEIYFDQVHQNFFKRLRSRFPDLTPKDQKLCAYLRMNLTTKEVAPLMHISVRGVEIGRYRLRKKLELDTDTNLVSFIMEI